MMHVLHLGVAHFCTGGALLCLMSLDFFGTFANTVVSFTSFTFTPQNASLHEA